MAETFDALRAAVFLVKPGGYILHANMAGHVMLAAGDVLFSAAGRLAAHEAEVDQSLRDVFAVSGGAAGVQGVAMPLTARDGTRHVVHVLPLASGARRRAGAPYAAAAAVFVNGAALGAPSLPQIIAKVFKLTPTELRVLLAIIEVGPVPDVAVALGIAESTVKTHLRRLFDKTGASRQVDLVKLVAGFCSPLLR
jgi:DNA-binding CsgD family transcriptional regulator